MKNRFIVFMVLILTSIMGCNSKPKITNEQIKLLVERKEQVAKMAKTEIDFPEKHFDFGTIKEGDVVEHEFRFKNIGQQPLMIADVIVSCGCTVPTYTKEPIAPGGTGSIKIKFNSVDKSGKVNKNIIIVSNAKTDRYSIGFEAIVK